MPSIHARLASLAACGLLASCPGSYHEELPSGEALLHSLRARFPGAAQRLVAAPENTAGDELRASVPMRAGDALVLEFHGLRAQIAAVGARGAERRGGAGVAHFADAYEDADLIQLSAPGRIEQLVLLRGPRAPARYDFDIGVTGGRLTGSGDLVADSGGAQLRLERPWALDADGRPVEVSVTVRGSRLSLSIDPRGHAFPLLLDPAWFSTSLALAASRYDHAATLLADGSVVVCGGYNVQILQDCERFDPTAGTWSAAPFGLSVPRTKATATLLRDGQVLICGGGSNTCDRRDPKPNSPPIPCAPMNARRSDASATLLADGRVLMAGGDVGGLTEVYDPAADSWTPSGSVTGRTGAPAVAAGGKVFLIGGLSPSTGALRSVDVFDPATRSWSAGPELPVGLIDHAATALRDGTLVVTGGAEGSTTAVKKAWSLAPGAASWTSLPDMAGARRRHASLLLPTGELLVAGGNDGYAPLDTTELLDPVSLSWSIGSVLREKREKPAAAVLPTGEAVLVGGKNTKALQSAELYLPSRSSGLTPPMGYNHQFPSVFALSTGKRLIFGHTQGTSTDSRTNSTLWVGLFDPNTLAWGAGFPQTTTGYEGGTRTLLADDRVLTLGGVRAWYEFSSPFTHDSAYFYRHPSANGVQPAAPMPQGRAYHTATRLASGRVLVAGGVFQDTTTTNSAVLFDPVANSWTALAPMKTARHGHTATLLSNGSVLVIGGYTSYRAGPTATAEIYDPASNTWSDAASTLRPHAQHQVAWAGTRLLLVPSGDANECELYDPATNNWTLGPKRAYPASTDFALTSLPSGAVLVSGGWQPGTPPVVDLAELFDPATATWRPLARLQQPRYAHAHLVLPDGRVMLAGGFAAAPPSQTVMPVATTETLDPRPPQLFDAAGQLASTRAAPVATVLPSGDVLITGSPDSNPSASAELFKSSAGTFVPLAPMKSPYLGHTSTLLQDGRVLIVGDTAEIFDPALGSWTAVAAPLTGRRFHTATLLPTGKLLIAAGEGAPSSASPGSALRSTELYDPATDLWSPGPDLALARKSHAAALLPSGDVVVAGGYAGALTRTATVEKYDGTSWTALPPMSKARAELSATPLASGRVLVGGGTGASADAEVFDPGSSSWSTVAAFESHLQHAAVLLPDGRVLFVGGGKGAGSSANTDVLEVYNPVSKELTLHARLRTARSSPAAVLLPDGRVLVVGGRADQTPGSAALDDAEILAAPSVAHPASRPRLDAPVGLVFSGGNLTLRGAMLRGPSQTHAGTFATAAADHPLLTLLPLGGGRVWQVAPSDFSDTELTAFLPAALGEGYVLATALVAGVPSAPLLIEARRGGLGAPCSSDVGCASGHCVDRVCCSDAACALCNACNGPGGTAAGTCRPLVAGQPDDDPAGSCVQPMACDGAGACLSALGRSCSSRAECASGFCADGRCCDAACTEACKACDLDSTGHCTLVAQGRTDPGSCAAPNTCNGSGQCLSELGRRCVYASECASGLCVDFVCCDDACQSTCFSCAVAGSVGRCTAVPRGEPDDVLCGPASTPVPKACTGSGGCAFANGQRCVSGSQCASGMCADGVCCDAPCASPCEACDATGHCAATLRNLTDPGTCDSPNACDGMRTCVGGLGHACTVPAECTSGFCVDGHCCENACADDCVSCANPQGACVPVLAGQPDPGTCDSPNACDATGYCRLGVGKPCTLPSQCGTGYCVDGVCCSSARCAACDGCAVEGRSGVCSMLPSGTPDDGCPAPNLCDGAGGCKKSNGTACLSGDECLTGRCVDGFCCETDCTGTCMSCAISAGKCLAVPVGGSDSACSRPFACDGAGRCALADGRQCAADVDCASGHCVDGYCCESACAGACESCNGVCTPLANGAPDALCARFEVCDGQRRCKLALGQPCALRDDCASGVCADGTCCATACAAGCTTCANATGECEAVTPGDADPHGSCLAPTVCDSAGGCKLPDGERCGEDSECLHAHCAQGTCCNTACAGDCFSCALEGSVGQCAFVQRDTRCGPEKVCDGRGGCLGVQGATCTEDAQCLSGACAQGVCCNVACKDGPCQACSKAAGAAEDGICQIVPAKTPCGPPPQGDCDRPEVCDGVTAQCPADEPFPAGELCRASAGVCDVEERCTGESKECPKNDFQPDETACRREGDDAKGVCRAGHCEVFVGTGSEEAALSPDMFALTSCGCGAAPGEGGGLLAMGLASLALLRGRRRRTLALAAGLAALATLAPALAAAQPAPEPASAALPAAEPASPAPPAAELAPAPARPAPPRARRTKVAVLALQAGNGVEPRIAEMLTDSLASSIAERPQLATISSSDIAQALNFERQRELVGCTEGSCLAEIGGALGVDVMVSGSLGRLGDLLLLNVQALNLRKGLVEKRFTTRIAGGDSEALLDAAAAAAEEMFGPSPLPRRRSVIGARWSLMTRLQAKPGLSPVMTVEDGVQAERSAPSGALVAVGSYQLRSRLNLGVGMLVARHLGVLGRVSWVPLWAEKKLHPLVALEIPVVFADPVATGIGATVGAEWAPTSWLALGLELPFWFFATAPAGSDRAYLFLGASAAVRF